MTDELILSELNKLGCVTEPCGSRVTCNPPPANTDRDFLVLATQDCVSEIVSLLSQSEFRWEGDSEHYQNVAQSGFMSWRKGDLNLIVTASKAFADRHRTATYVCRRLNLMDKQDRIAVFQAVLYGRQWEGPPKPVNAAPRQEEARNDVF